MWRLTWQQFINMWWGEAAAERWQDSVYTERSSFLWERRQTTATQSSSASPVTSQRCYILPVMCVFPQVHTGTPAHLCREREGLLHSEGGTFDLVTVDLPVELWKPNIEKPKNVTSHPNLKCAVSSLSMFPLINKIICMFLFTNVSYILVHSLQNSSNSNVKPQLSDDPDSELLTDSSSWCVFLLSCETSE